MDLLLGLDVLGEHFVRIDWTGRTVTFSTERLAPNGIRVPVTTFMGIPVVELHARGDGLRAFLDTAAKLSYIPGSITGSLPSRGTVHDFYRMFGAFATPVFDLKASLAGESFPVRAGILPTRLQMWLMLGALRVSSGAICSEISQSRSPSPRAEFT